MEYASKKKAARQKIKITKPHRQRMQARLAAAIAPLHTVTRAKMAIDVALTRTAVNATQQVAILFSEAAMRTGGNTTKSLMDEAEDDLEDALDELDRSEPFGGKAGFSEHADFPRVCYEHWQEAMRNLAERHHKIEERLKAKGDPDAHQKANDAIRNSSIAITENFMRCLRQPIRKLPVPTP